MVQADAALRARRLAEVVSLADEAITLVEDGARAHALRGIAAAERGALEDGTTSLLRALSLDAQAVPVALAERGTRLLLKTNHAAEARQLVEPVVRSASPGAQRDQLFTLYGDTLMSLGPDHIDAAVGAYREALRATGLLPHARLGLALALRRQGRPETEWKPAVEAAANQAAQSVLLNTSLPATETESRAALLMEHSGDSLGAQSAWDRARSGPWSDFAQAASRALGPPE